MNNKISYNMKLIKEKLDKAFSWTNVILLEN